MSPLPDDQAYVIVERVRTRRPGVGPVLFKLSGLHRCGVEFLDAEAVPAFEGDWAEFVVVRPPNGTLRFVRQAARGRAP